ncbi:CopG family transcriptional regulator [Escherichia phage vB_EcoS-UDF157lw]|uniref:CopG family transcriptional regulator n=1 Tax=Escherichia phage vB_EcoS-UDF157lw TaxID=3024423 RepID=A0AAE9XTK5_9CAUD|nr:CopG family transcriptional regulator [Escherichia phage vB_EcoS-UDF157lw]
MILINLSERQAKEIKAVLMHCINRKLFSSSESLTEVVNQIRNQEFEDILPWEEDLAWLEYEQVCTALSGCQLASQYK